MQHHDDIGGLMDNKADENMDLRVSIEEDKLVYDGFYKVKMLKLKRKQFDGQWSRSYEREVVICRPAVVVLPYDPRQDKVVLIEQMRVGTIFDQPPPWLLECVAGVVDREVSVDVLAKQELLEETGLHCDKLEPVMRFWSSPGGSTEYMHGFYAKIDADNAGGIHGLSEENEEIRSCVLTRKQAYDAIAQGRVADASTIVMLQWLQMSFEALQKRD
jgi:ADP-ribose pyrophosphatase